MKKKLSKNFYRKLRNYFKRLGVDFETFGAHTIRIKSGILSGFIFTPNDNYCKVCHPRFVKQMAVTFNFCVNNSTEVLFYKLFRHNLVNLKTYSDLLQAVDYGKAKIKLSA